MKSHIRLLATLSIISLGGVFVPLGGLFISPHSSALSYQDSVDVEFTFNPSISVTVSGDLVIENLAPGSSSDSNIIDVSVATNNISGYVLTATAGNTSHTNTDLTKSGIENKFSSVATNADLSSITTDNTWGYSFSNNAGSSWTNYSGLPLYTAETGKELVSVDTNTVAPIKFKIAAKASTNQPAGTYTNVINFIAVANPEPELGPVGCEARYICYQPNALTGVQGTMANQRIGNSGGTQTLYPSNYSRNGYGFAGWSDVYDYDTNPNAHFYGPNEEYTTPSSDYSTEGLSLYAVWVKSEGRLQDANKVTSLCGTGGVGGSLTKTPINSPANLSSVTALTDQRDNQTYAIAKLADGNCWMIENLRLENTASHNSDGSLAQGYNSSFIGLAEPESDNFAFSTVANSLYSIDGSTEKSISGSNQQYRFPRYNNYNTQQRGSNTGTSGYIYSFGNNYTWAAAIADTTHYTSGDHGSTSICPSGWRIPQANTTSAGFGKLDVEMGGTGTTQSTKEAVTRWRRYPVNFIIYNDVFHQSSMKDGGYYWSSTAANSNYYSYAFYVDTLRVRADGVSYLKTDGLSVRCTTGL